MATSNRDRVGRAFERLAEALDEFIAYAVAQAVPAGQNWTVLLAARDAKKGITGKTYDRGDVQAQLRMLTENIGHALQPGWYPFDEKLSRAEKSLADELRDTRNQWAHLKPFSADDAYRALDSAERFLRAIGAPADADAVRDDRIELRRLSSENQDRKVVAAASTVGAEGLAPWREVLQPHRDVAAGNFQAAEFAADLYRVAPAPPKASTATRSSSSTARSSPTGCASCSAVPPAGSVATPTPPRWSTCRPPSAAARRTRCCRCGTCSPGPRWTGCRRRCRSSWEARACRQA